MTITSTALPTTISPGRTGFTADAQVAWAALNALTLLLSGASSADAAAVRAALSVPALSAMGRKIEVVRWVPGTGWGTYDTDPNVTRFFNSQNDAAATAPIKGSDFDAWFRHRDAT